MKPDYLRNCLISISSSRPTQAGREGMLQASSAKGFQLVGSSKRAFSAVLWNFFPLEARQTPTLLVLQKSIRTWLHQLALGSKNAMQL